MQDLPLPLAREVVLVGGGHTHALFLRRWGMKPVPGARVTVINPAPTAPYTGMLPGFVAGHYTREELEIDLVRLARFAGARVILGRVEALNRKARTVNVEGRPPIPYDVASLDIGITSNMPEIPGFTEHAVAAKPLGPFARRWRDFLSGETGPVAVIGAGIAGVELALTMNHALGGRSQVTIVEEDRALDGSGARDTLLARLAAEGIDLIEHATVAEVRKDGLRLSDGREIPAFLTVGAAGARPFPWLEGTGLKLNGGFVAVDKTLRSVSDPSIYATGDCAHISHAPRPKAGVFAVRAAPILAHNIRADLIGGRHKAFNPQRNYLKLISLGPEEAVAEKWDFSLSGRWAWTWKDRIDRTFMSKLNNPPRMAAQAVPKTAAEGVREALGPKPLCGGCGAKVGSDVLDRVLQDLRQPARDDIETEAGDDAAVIRIGEVRQVISTDHLRAFWEDPWIMARIAAVHALGDVWAMGAKPQAALAEIILPRMAERMQEAWLSEIMAAATGIFGSEGAAIVGGHTTLGAELVIGFTVTGLAEGRPLTIGGAKTGDALLLTRPIGSGTVLAAEMEGKARGDDVVAVLGVMSRPQGEVAALLAKSANAMTDVTGFGLAGHLARMAIASGNSSEIDLASVPLYPGAEALSAAGIRSSIWEANRASVEATAPDTPLGALMFDPQTAGGLLAALPPELAQEALEAIRAQGHDAAIIGRMTARGPVTLTVR